MQDVGPAPDDGLRAVLWNEVFDRLGFWVCEPDISAYCVLVEAEGLVAYEDWLPCVAAAVSAPGRDVPAASMRRRVRACAPPCSVRIMQVSCL